MLGEIIPEPTDPVFIWLADWLKVNNGMIPTWQYWLIWTFNYYLLSATWYMFLLALVFGLELELRERFFVGLALLSGGAVAGLVGILAIGKQLPGVGNLGLGYTVFFAGIAALVAFGAFVSYHFLTEDQL